MSYCHEDVTIYPQVRLPEHHHIEQGVYIPPGVILGNHIFLGPRVVFTNDPFPRCGVPAGHAPTFVRDGASIGANCTILPYIEICEHAMVGAGSVVTEDIPRGTVWAGNPAKFIRFVTEGEWHPLVKIPPLPPGVL